MNLALAAAAASAAFLAAAASSAAFLAAASSAAFFAAATPIPDDLVYVPLGLAKYNPKRFFIATLTGLFLVRAPNFPQK